MKDPFFIVGNSRSGTTLVAEILKNHSSVHVLNETHFIEEFSNEKKSFEHIARTELFRLINTMLTIQRKDYYRKSEYEIYPMDYARVIALYDAQKTKNFATLNKCFLKSEALKKGKEWGGDQTPRHVFHINEILEMYPEAKFIHMVRDARAILFSQKNKWKASLRHGHPKFEIIRTYLNYHPVTTSMLWKNAIKAGLSAQNKLNSKIILTIRFEDLVNQPQKTITTLCDFLKIPYQAEMPNVSVTLCADKRDEGKKGIDKEISTRWRSGLSQTEIFLADAIGGDQMRKLGYTTEKRLPNPLSLMLWITLLPLQLVLAFAINLGRMGNPISYLYKRLMPETKGI